MRIDTNILGAVRTPDAGVEGPPATSRRDGREDYATAFGDLVALSRVADEAAELLRMFAAEVAPRLGIAMSAEGQRAAAA